MLALVLAGQNGLLPSLLSRSARPNQGVDLRPSSSQRKEGVKETTIPAFLTANITQAEQQQRELASSDYLR